MKAAKIKNKIFKHIKEDDKDFKKQIADDMRLKKDLKKDLKDMVKVICL